MEDLVRYFLFQPPRPTSIPRKFVLIETRLKCLIPVCYISYPKAKKTILYSHGNAEDLARICNYLEDISRILKVNVICYDYSGYGLSKPGKDFDNESNGEAFGPSEERCYADIEAVYSFITKGKRLLPSNILLYGRSLGSGPSCYLAQKLSRQGIQIGGLILHSPFMSVYRIVLNFGFNITGDKFMNINRISDISCPIFLIHGTVDSVVPFSHGEAIQDSVQEKCKTTPFWALDMGHNDIEVNMAGEFLRRLQDFLHYTDMKDLFEHKKRVLMQKQSEIDMLKKIISKKINSGNSRSTNRKGSNVMNNNTSTRGMKLFVESEEDRHENEQKDKSSSRMNDYDFDILNLCSPRSLTRQVSITVEEGKVEVLSDSEEEVVPPNNKEPRNYHHSNESPYELKSTSKEFTKFSSPIMETRLSAECRI